MDPIVQQDIMHLLTTKYADKIGEIIEAGGNTIIVDFNDLREDSKEVLRKDYISCKYVGINIDELAEMAINTHNREDPKKRYLEGPIVKDAALFFMDVTPKVRIRDIVANQLNGLMEINGTIISVTPPLNLITKAVYRCNSCREEIHVTQTTNQLEKPNACLGKCKSKSFILLEGKSSWQDYQEVIIQENPDEVSPGNIPRTIRGKLIGEPLMDIVKPGSMGNISCALVPVPTRGRRNQRIFERMLDINYIDVLNKETFGTTVEPGDLFELNYLSEDPNIQGRLVQSIFPSIYGREMEKLGLVLAMFGGTDELRQDITIRGTINVLLLGDPGLGKTRMLQCILSAAPKAIYTSGKGSSSVGLTAAAVKDELAGWRLEAGAVVLADNGICCVDEIDKMENDQREGLHECMSSQTVSINKATIHTTLNARTTIIAAANPAGGKYDMAQYLTDNINLPVTILNRFDLIFIMRDIPDADEDLKMSEMILGEPVTEEALIPIDTIKKYILYAKTVTPRLTEEAVQVIRKYYLSLRAISSEVMGSPIAITVRQLEGLKRLAQASARMRLSKLVEAQDAELAVIMMRETMEKAGYDPKKGVIDAGILSTGQPASKTDRLKVFEQLLKNIGGQAHRDWVIERAMEVNIGRMEVEEFIKTLSDRGVLYFPSANSICHITNSHTIGPEDY